jgi:hypothetical protein
VDDEGIAGSDFVGSLAWLVVDGDRAIIYEPLDQPASQFRQCLDDKAVESSRAFIGSQSDDSVVQGFLIEGGEVCLRHELGSLMRSGVF